MLNTDSSRVARYSEAIRDGLAATIRPSAEGSRSCLTAKRLPTESSTGLMYLQIPLMTFRRWRATTRIRPEKPVFRKLPYRFRERRFSFPVPSSEVDCPTSIGTRTRAATRRQGRAMVPGKPPPRQSGVAGWRRQRSLLAAVPLSERLPVAPTARSTTREKPTGQNASRGYPLLRRRSKPMIVHAPTRIRARRRMGLEKTLQIAPGLSGEFLSRVCRNSGICELRSWFFSISGHPGHHPAAPISYSLCTNPSL